ncbi:MAG: GNAT family N-acetyltransferase [bacterium]
MDIIIRKANISDFLNISELDRQAWKDNRNSDFIPDGEHVWRLWVEYSTVFVAEYNKKIVGVVLLFKANECSLYLFHKIFIDKNYRDKKLGNMFFKNIVNFLDCEKADCLLTTDPINSRMIHLCAKYGFNDKQLIKGYYRQDENRMVIRRNQR